MSEMQSRYEPQGVEERWQRTWEEEGLYNADPDPSRTPYVDCHPPPNVTGELHTGHALQLAIGDTMIRMKRMQGFNALFQPGYDHAGISTQNAVEKALVAEGTSRQALGREKFEERVWDWLHEYGGKILDDFRRIGASLDYRRSRMTMDDGYSRAVLQWFVHLYGRGWALEGWKVDLVMIFFIPRDGELTDSLVWSEPYNENIALNALARMNQLNGLLQAIGLEQALSLYAECEGRFCPWCSPGRKLTAATSSNPFARR